MKWLSLVKKYKQMFGRIGSWLKLRTAYFLRVDFFSVFLVANSKQNVFLSSSKFSYIERNFEKLFQKLNWKDSNKQKVSGSTKWQWGFLVESLYWSLNRNRKLELEIGDKHLPKCDPILAVSGRDRPPSHLPDRRTLSGSGWSDANDATRLDRCRFPILLFRFITELEFLTEQSGHLWCNVPSRFEVRPGNGFGAFVQPYRLIRRGCKKSTQLL